MRTNFLIILLFFIAIGIQQSFAQEIDKDYEAVLLMEEDASTDLFSSAFKPIFGLGQGILTFYGDIRNNYESPLNGKWGTSVSISRSLGRFFDVDLYALFGKTSGERRSLEDLSLNKNFETEIFIGGVSASYNFNHIFRRKDLSILLSLWELKQCNSSHEETLKTKMEIYMFMQLMEQFAI